MDDALVGAGRVCSTGVFWVGVRDQWVILQRSRFSHAITQAPGIGH